MKLEGVPIREQRLDTGEVRLNYAEGPRHGAPLVLLHGGGSWRSLEPIMPALAARWHLYAPDLRGHGGSTWTPGRYTNDDYTRDVEAFLDTVVREPAVLLGQSLGASTALMAAAHHLSRARALILDDAPKARHPGEAWQDYIGRLRGYVERLPAEQPAGLSTDPTGWALFRHETECSLGTFDVAALAPRVTCPVLILQADPARGSQLDDADVAALLRLFPDARHVLLAARRHGL